MLDTIDGGAHEANAEIISDRIRLLMQRGGLFPSANQFDQALASYQQAGQILSKNPALAGRSEYDSTRARLAVNRGICLKELNHLEEALESYAVRSDCCRRARRRRDMSVAEITELARTDPLLAPENRDAFVALCANHLRLAPNAQDDITILKHALITFQPK